MLRSTFSKTYYQNFSQLLKSTLRIKNIKYLLAALLTIVFIIFFNITNSTQAKATLPPSPSSISSNVSVLVQQGKDHYQIGRYNEAIAVWEQARESLIKQDDELNQAVVSTNLALAYQQLGKWDLTNKAIAESLSILNQAASTSNSTSKTQNILLLAQALNIQGSLLLSQGKAEEALDVWQQANTFYEKLKDTTGVTQTLLNQTQAMRMMGFYRRTKVTLEKVNKILENQPDSPLKIAALVNLGDTLRVSGDLKTSQEVLQESLKLAEKLNSPSDITTALLSLGNTARSAQQSNQALNYYQKAITTSPPASTTKLQAELNKLRLLIETDKYKDAEAFIPQIQSQLENLTPNRTSIYARVNFVQSLIKLRSRNLITETQENTSINTSTPQLVKILAIAVQHAKAIGDNRTESYALGYLGELYEKNQQYDEAKKLTEKALELLIQIPNAADIAYRWQWQLGRLLKTEDKLDEAIIAYSEAVKNLGSIRNDLVASNLDVQFSFRESVEPVYREFVSLLLTPKLTKGEKEVEQKNLKKAREVIESLQLAELDNYFREACLTAHPEQIDQIDPQAAVIYPILLSDRLEVVVSVPKQPLHHYPTIIPQSDAEKIFEKMLKSMRRTSLGNERLQIAKQVYDLIIKPAESDFANNNIKTLVFVLDGALKNIPIAALYDGKQYLMEKYSLALTPGLQLLAPHPLEKQRLKLLVGGLSESRQGFVSLPGVEAEIKEIKSEISSQVLFNQSFTSQKLQKQIDNASYPIVHLATHGQFSSNPENTFVLTWDNRIDVKELGELLKSREQDNRIPIELLVLSACQTADGDKRAALGLAGVAVKSGARSTLASLWPVDDQSTSLFMAQFYSELTKSTVTKAEALRRAQIALIKQLEFQHPYYWAPFVMVGNWL
jgi:CHAT domain-containing protein